MTHISREVYEIVQNLRLIDDELFKVVSVDIPSAEEILQPFFGNEKIEIVEVNIQKHQVNIKREVRVDAECILRSGTRCNIEVQKGRKNNDVKRTRFHTSVMTVNSTEKGTPFSEIPNVVSIYISEYDALNNGQRVTMVKRCQKKGNEYVPIDDGELIIFANTIFTEEELQDIEKLSRIDRLLLLFRRRDIFYDEMFPNLSNRIRYFKENREGDETMSLAVEQYGDRREAYGRSNGISYAIEKTARNMKAENADIDFISRVTGLTVEEIEDL